ncbi:MULTISPECIES: 1,4-alpha-glucan branching protein GlgB [Acidiplasma]|uniref:1,4-alpha-glucan branching enzyme GlgB n=1 Tax=Acidiplasma aeolicum TaxID=507754 RepID=A0A0Q0WFH0_9ARCH|nr:1,4-alpha-glucan branching protein GlgB [Acidiplasma aeolicum]KQB34114.1 hypothetical protein AOG54_05660 [Acidiplasma aeolicum]
MSGIYECLKNVKCNHPEKHLGMHFENGSYVIRAYLPIAVNAYVIINDKKYKMIETDNKIFQANFNDKINKYMISYTDSSGYEHKYYDPYNFRPAVSDYDIYLFKEGKLFESYKTFGSHLIEIDGVSGCNFTVWAPSALSVSVVGNFNHWTPGMHPMININDSGIWSIFIPGISENEVYKYAINTSSFGIKMKTDPYAFYTEKRPRTSSIVIGHDFNWNDSEWINKRNILGYNDPVSIYEMHLGSWRKNGDKYYSYREIAPMLIEYLKKTGFNYVEFMPLTEYPLDISWGYQAVNYYAPTSRYGRPEDLKYLINELHRNGIGVILDFVAAHFPDDDYGLYMFDGTHLYDYADPRKGRTPDWGTNIFDFGKNEVRSFLISAIMYWIDEFHIDGIRVDAVTSMIYLDFSRKPGEWIPNIYGGNINLEAVSLLTELNSTVHEKYHGVITVAEESSTYKGITSRSGIGFDYKWNMGWMHDTLDFFHTDPLYRKYNIGKLTFTVMYAYSERFILPISHDEVVYGKGSLYQKMPGDYNLKISNIRLFMSYMFAYPGKKLLFMGNEFAQKNEWDSNSQLQWNAIGKPEEGLLNLINDLNSLYKEYDDLHIDENFSWIDFNDVNNTVISFMRGNIVCIFNFTPVERENYAIGVDSPGTYTEIFNSDSSRYGGSNHINKNIESCNYSMHGRKYSIEINLPPLSAIYLRNDAL